MNTHDGLRKLTSEISTGVDRLIEEMNIVYDDTTVDLQIYHGNFSQLLDLKKYRKLMRLTIYIADVTNLNISKNTELTSLIFDTKNE